jgi:hypothetical protein
MTASILVPVLFITFLLSTGCLTFLLSLFLVHRLYLHISAACTVDSPTSDGSSGRQVGGGAGAGEDAGEGNAEQTPAAREYEYTYERIASGISSWMDETKARIIPARYLVLTPTQSAADGEKDTRGPTVMVKEEDKEDGGSEMTLVGEVTGVKVEQDEGQIKGGKRVRWSVSEGSNGPADRENGASGAVHAGSQA